MKRLLLLPLFLAVSFISFAQEYFGPNKVQYDQFEFKIHQTDHFSIYYYESEAEAAKKVAVLSEIWYERLSKVFDYRFRELNPIILYASPEHFAQTDIIPGIISEGVGGVTESDMNRVIIPLTASWEDNNHVLGHELVHAFQFKILLSSDSTHLRNVANIPLWMMEGMAEYLSIGPADPNTTMWLRDALLNDRFPTLKKMTTDYHYFPYRWGQAFWSYVAGTWGEEKIPQLFESAARYGYDGAIHKVLGLKAKEFDEKWKAETLLAYNGYLNADINSFSVGTRLFEDKKSVSEQDLGPAISPNGKYVVFLTSRDLFSLDLYLADAKSRKIIRKLKTERGDGHGNFMRLTESAATWSSDSRSVAFFSYESGNHYLRIQEAESDKNKQKILLENFHSVLNPAWSPDGKKIAFVGVIQGNSNLYVYDLKKKTLEQLTDDAYTDLQPSWSPDSKNLVFVTDRFSGTDFSLYKFSNLEIARISISNKQIEKLPLFNGVSHINPQYNKDSTLYFIASPDGVNNIYRLNSKTKVIEQVTHEKTAVAGITETSPAMSIAIKTGDIIYSVFKGSGYQIEALRAKNIKAVPINDSLGKDFSAGILPPLQTRLDDEVTGYLASSENNVTMDSTFKSDPYKVKLKLSSISNAGVGVGLRSYGVGLGGGVTTIFSDMMNEHIVYGSLSAAGSIQDIGGVVGYLNQKHRLSWGATLSHIPYGYASYFAFYDTLRIDGILNLTYNLDQYILREFNDGLNGVVYYPLTQRYRVEGGLGVTFVNYSYQNRRDVYLSDAFGYPLYQIDQDIYKLDAPSGFTYGTAALAFVGDHSKFGFTSPLDGYRFRVETDAIFGGFNFGTLLTDFRAYKYVKPVSFAGRFIHYGRYFGDANDSLSISPLTVGADYLIRGYNYYSFDFNEVPFGENGSPAIDRLFGSKMSVINFEVRFPLTGPREIAPIKSLAFPSTLQLFFDGGVAWGGTPPVLKWTTDFNELTTNPARYPVFSAGASLRVNVLGAIVMEGYYAIPFQRPLHDPFNKDASIQSLQLSNGVFGLLFYPGW